MSQCSTSTELRDMPTSPPLESFSATAASLAADLFLMMAFCFRTCRDYMLQMHVDIKARMREFELKRLKELESHESGTNMPPQPPPSLPPPPPHEEHQPSANRLRALSEFLKNPDVAQQYLEEDTTSAEPLQHGDIVHIVNDAEQTQYSEQLFLPIQQQAIVFILQCEERSSTMLCIPFRRRKDRRRPNPHKRYWPVVQVDEFPATRTGDQLSSSASAARDHHDRTGTAIHGRYPHPTHTDSHARPSIPHSNQTADTSPQSPRSSQAPNTPSSKLLICLDEGLELETGITMDLADIRRIEYRGLTLGTIGWMDEGSAKIIVQEVKAIVQAWLKKLSPEEEEELVAEPGVGQPMPPVPPPAPRPPGGRPRGQGGRRGATQSRLFR